jgi:hypothetical protein
VPGGAVRPFAALPSSGTTANACAGVAPTADAPDVKTTRPVCAAAFQVAFGEEEGRGGGVGV